MRPALFECELLKDISLGFLLSIGWIYRFDCCLSLLGVYPALASPTLLHIQPCSSLLQALALMYLLGEGRFSSGKALANASNRLGHIPGSHFGHNSPFEIHNLVKNIFTFQTLFLIPSN